MDPMWHNILGLVMIVLGFMGWSGNGVVVYVFLMTPSLRTPSNLLIINLAFSDFIMMVIMSPPMVINCYYQTWVLGNANSSRLVIVTFSILNLIQFNFILRTSNVRHIRHGWLSMWMRLNLDYDCYCSGPI